MAVDPSFPLSPSDQAEVIRIFLELMSEGRRDNRASGPAAANRSLGAGHDSHDPRFPSGLLDLD